MKNFNEELDRALNTWGAPKEALAEIVASYQNNELGSSSNTGDNSNSISGCECGDKVDLLQQQIEELTASLNQTTEKLNLLLNKLYDRSAIYNTEYEHIDPSVLFRTYDCIEKEKAFVITSSQTTYPVALFCLNGSESTVKLTLNMKTTAKDSAGKIEIYLNGTLFDTVLIDNITTNTERYEFFFTMPLLETGNFIETIVYTTNSNSLEVSYLKYEAYNCTNPTFVDANYKYNVDYIAGKYYFTDCSGKTAKYAIAPVESFNSINDLTWVDTGIEAITYRFIANLLMAGDNYYHDENVSYFYITKDNQLHLYNHLDEVTHGGEIIHADPIPARYNEVNLLTTNINGRNIYTQMAVYKPNKAKTYIYINTASKYCLCFSPKYMFKEQAAIIPRNVYILHALNNNIEVYYNPTTTSLGYGKFISGYILNTNPMTVEIYTKVHDYCTKHTLTYNSSKKLTSYTSEVCGTYDHYFKGVKNDYFTVENGIWHYYQSDLLES